MDTSSLPVSSQGLDALAVARLCRDAAGAIMREQFGTAKMQAVKGRGNIVTAVDYEVEVRVKEIIAAHFPDHAILAEETGGEADPEAWLWVIDPLDGTKNFASGIPYFCFTLGLWRGVAEPVLGLTYQPLLDEEFVAVRGQGAYAGDVRLAASERQTVLESVLAVDLGYIDSRGKNMLGLVHDLWPGMQTLRICGSAALGMAYAACGRYDLFVHNNVYPWDIAGGILLNLEAGGRVTDREGQPISLFSEGIVCGGPAVHAEFLERTKDRPWRD